MFIELNYFPDQAENIFNEMREYYQRNPDLKNRFRTAFVRHYSKFLKSRDRTDEELLALKEYLTLSPRSFDFDIRVRNSLWRLVTIYCNKDQPDEALPLIRRALQAKCKSLSRNNPEESTLWDKFSLSFSNDQDVNQITLQVTNMLHSMSDQTGIGPYLFVKHINELIRYCCYYGYSQQADQLIRASLELLQNHYPNNKELQATTIGVQGVCSMYNHQHEKAEHYLIQSYNLALHGSKIRKSEKKESITRLINLYERTHQDKKATVYREKLHVAEKLLITDWSP